MDLRGVIKAMNDGTEIKGMFFGTTFLWPDPWSDIWDEGVAVIWENVWRNQWSVPYVESIP
jgi:hypothetical protein